MSVDSPVRKVSTTSAVTALVGFLILLVVLLGGFLVWRDYSETVSRTEAQAENTARTAAEHVRWLVEANLQALRRIDQALEGSITVFSRTETQELSDAVAALPGEPDLWVVNARLIPVLSTNLDAKWADIADDPSLRAIRDGEPWVVSGLIVGKETGRKLFTISRRVTRDGKFLGAVVIAVPGNLLSQFWLSLGTGVDSTVGLFRSDGVLVARYPVPDAPLDLSKHELFTRHLKNAPSGFYRSPTSPVDGVVRVVGYQRVPGLPLVTVAGASMSVALEPFWYRLRLLLIVGLPLVAAFIATVIWVSILLRRDEGRQRELASALDQNQMLLREVHHRVKNNLQIVASLVNLQGGPPEGRQELARRIAAISSVHEQIYLADQFAQIDLAHYIGSIVKNLKETYGADAEIALDLEPIVVEINTALPLALIVSEITSNAFKHAFRNGATGGRLSFHLRQEGERARLRIADNGAGFDLNLPRRGLGMRLVEGFCRQIGAACTYSIEGGLVFELDFPLKRKEAPEEVFFRRAPSLATS